jgi:thiamine transport system substrate-binding protein
MKLFRLLSLLTLAALLLAACAAPAAQPQSAATVAASFPDQTATQSAENPNTGSTATLPATWTPAPAATDAPAPTITDAAPSDAPELVVMTHDSFAVTADLVNQFEAENKVKVTFVKSGDAGAALNKAILSKNAPIADVFYGLDNTFLSRALDEGIFEPYNSPQLSQVDEAFKLDKTNGALPVDYGDVCINYDKTYFKDKNLALPVSFEDLLKPEYKGLLVVENPATSSPGLAFLLASIAHFGSDKYLDFWRQLKDNGLQVVDGWETAYYTNFSGSSGKGPQPLVVSYASSPAAEVVYAATPLTESPTASIVAPQTCFRQVEFVGILKGSKQRALAEKFIDFMLSKSFQEDMPLQMFVYPLLKGAALPEAFTKYNQVPEQPASLAPADIAKNRDTWINAWNEAVLK